VHLADVHGGEALKLITTTALDGVILELVHHEGGGLDLVRSVRAANPDLAILVYSMGDGALYAARVIRAGASGFVSKTDDVSTLVAALKKTLGGAVHVDEATAGRLLQAGGGSPLDRLTDRELEVLQLIGRGLRSRDIAENLRLSEKTIEGYRAQLRAKLGLADAASLLQHAIRWVRLSAV
jgi:DNA-binding NarL/FixJ family response regulator